MDLLLQDIAKLGEEFLTLVKRFESLVQEWWFHNFLSTDLQPA